MPADSLIAFSNAIRIFTFISIYPRPKYGSQKNALQPIKDCNALLYYQAKELISPLRDEAAVRKQRAP